MTKILRSFYALILLGAPVLCQASSLLAPFKTDDGRTNWQYVANFSSGVLIILLSLATLSLYVIWRRVRKYNRKLEEIKSTLESRVRERTKTLDQTNRSLQKSNDALAQEVDDHIHTTARLRESEGYLQSILNSMPFILVGLDKDGIVTHWNPRAEQASGIPADKAIGQDLWSIYPDITISPSHIKQARETGEAVTLRLSQPGSYHFDVTVYPLEDQSINSVMLLVDDVTKRVFAENMLTQHDKLASMGELASSMAHDISAPLQEILFDLRCFQSALESGSLIPSEQINKGETEKLMQLVENASSHGRQVDSIVHNLLQFARGRSETPEPALVTDVLDSAIEQAGLALSIPETIAFTDITIERHYAEGLPTVPCYVTALQQVFLSLLRHCYQAISEELTPPPTIRIEVSDTYGEVFIRISHNGKSLTENEQRVLFEPLENNNTPEAMRIETGKRLSFSHYVITEQHQGHMAVTSAPGEGSTFHIQLPPVRS